MVKDDAGKGTHAFWMSIERIAIARLFPHLILHDNTYQSNRYNLNIGPLVGVNNFGQSVLNGQSIVVEEKLATFSTSLPLGWRPWASRPWSCSRMHL